MLKGGSPPHYTFNARRFVDHGATVASPADEFRTFANNGIDKLVPGCSSYKCSGSVS
jgi:hypothetical protein